MTDGLVTRIGKWIDFKWAAKATWLDVQEQESKCTDRHVGALAAIAEVSHETDEALGKIKTDIELIVKARSDDKVDKDVADLKTRMEKIELYSGMTRKVDPTKPPVVKSAFQM